MKTLTKITPIGESVTGFGTPESEKWYQENLYIEPDEATKQFWPVIGCDQWLPTKENFEKIVIERGDPKMIRLRSYFLAAIHPEFPVLYAWLRYAESNNEWRYVLVEIQKGVKARGWSALIEIRLLYDTDNINPELKRKRGQRLLENAKIIFNRASLMWLFDSEGYQFYNSVLKKGSIFYEPMQPTLF